MCLILLSSEKQKKVNTLCSQKKDRFLVKHQVKTFCPYTIETVFQENTACSFWCGLTLGCSSS